MNQSMIDMPKKYIKCMKYEKNMYKKINFNTVSRDAERAQKARSFAIKVWKMEKSRSEGPRQLL